MKKWNVLSSLQKRMLLQMMLGFFLGRVVLYGCNPIGAAYFAAGFVQGGSVLGVGIAVFAGMLTSLPLDGAVRYGVTMLALGLVTDLLEHWKIRLKMVLVEDTMYRVTTGIARVAKAGEEISGDTFSCMPLSNGEMLLALSDGMGSGPVAQEESQTVIELLEQLTETGFSKEISLRLINALYLTTDDNIRYATADVVVLDLYEGTSQYLKSGAAATWVRHEGKVEEIQGQALPVGIVKDEKPYIQKGKIYSGDYVIMMTDGVLDAFLGEEDVLIGYMEQNHKINPQEWAEDILTLALKQKNGQAMDDMSVIVAGIWEK